MADFAFRVLGPDGREAAGALAAPDRRTAGEILRGRGLHILDLRQRAVAAAARPRLAGQLRLGIPAGQTVRFFRQLAVMLRSGLPMVQALTVLREHSPKARLRRVAERLSVRILAGTAFSAALAEERGRFPELALRMAATGEATGDLDAVLERVAVEVERRAELRTLLLTSMLYPSLVVLMTAGVVGFLVGNVIPKFARILQSRDVPLPATTQALVDLTGWLNAHAIGLAAGAAAGGAALAVAILVPATRRHLDALALRLPVVGGLLRTAVTAQFGRSLSLLLASGVPLLEALRLLRESFANAVVRARIAGAEAGLLEGRPLSALLRGHPLPPMVPEMMAVGEVTGTLDRVLAEVGDYHEAMLRQRVRVLALLVEPALILVVGGIVGFVYLSFFQVLFQMSAR